EHRGNELERVECGAVAPQGVLVLTAAFQVAERAGGQPPPGHAGQIVDAVAASEAPNAIWRGRPLDADERPDLVQVHLRWRAGERGTRIGGAGSVASGGHGRSVGGSDGDDDPFVAGLVPWIGAPADVPL